jgi:hypothetical protein
MLVRVATALLALTFATAGMSNPDGGAKGIPSGSAPAAAANGIEGVTVDVLVGYSPGMVIQYGGLPAVQKRIQQLVALTNQAYSNSEVLHRIRLVGTLQLNYTETNSNQSALEQVTGIRCAPACMPTPVPIELVPLRNAREQLGADLVVLLRPNRAPQHETCGTGWLIGEGGNLIGSIDAPFGYSIASDGADIDESSGLLVTCNDYTVAQQLGLNMGQAYNPEDAPYSGTHAYSYGYRQTQATGFHTIMALPLIGGSQFAIPHFSNPNVSFNGMATGTASQDNARSLNLSMPLIAQFRAEAASINQIFSSGFE